jgi:hypothetical protein
MKRPNSGDFDMTTAPNFLADDGSASMATALMMSHHAFRRDLARFARALAGGELSRVDPVREEWKRFRASLEGHHHAEDSGVFPGVLEKDASLQAVIDRLAAEHKLIDPLLERGSAVFAALPGTASEAASIVAELRALLDLHLAIEEAHIIPHLRAAKEFPAPPTDAEAEMYAQGFAWAMHGVAADVVERVYGMLPAALVSRLPAARAAFVARFEQVWGTADAGASRTPVPQAI